ncbi:MAG: polysaccharide biosynthesis protein [Firmicutes bacterium]|nr:polysaccharide biosynthesis protein [Bacillota bacterium]
MEQHKRVFTLVLLDAVLVVLSLYMALMIRFDVLIPVQYLQSFFLYAGFWLVIRLGTFYSFRLYHRLWQYASVGELITIVSAVTVSSLFSIVITYIFLSDRILLLPRGVIILDYILNICLIGGSRLTWRLFRDSRLRKGLYKTGKPILIVGAGDAGALVAKEFVNHYGGETNLIGFVDDDTLKHNSRLLGKPVLGGRDAIPEVVKKYKVEEIIIAMPSVPRKIIREIISICQETSAKIKILPGVFDLIDGNVTVSKIREVQLEDLLGREPVNLDLESVCGYLIGQVVLVTGAGGSIGSELCRQIAEFNPETLLLLDVCENNVYDIELELKKKYPELKVYPLVKDIRDRLAIDLVFKTYRPKVVFHAAAHKHVPLMEANPEEAIKNNVMGTYNVAQAANIYGAKRFVLISTDKAVNPTSVMGASKRVAEMVIQYLNETSKTNYAAVRFGNVLGSRGSVIPLFQQQIAEGGPVTVTDRNMIRYFMTIPEAVQLVLQAGAMTEGGEIFILDMGEMVKIIDLAKTLIRLSGFEPGEDIEIKETGMRPGEKLYEELMTSEEGVNATKHERIFVGQPTTLKRELIDKAIKEFHSGILPTNQEETLIWLQRFIPEFRLVTNASIEVISEVAATAEN